MRDQPLTPRADVPIPLQRMDPLCRVARKLSPFTLVSPQRPGFQQATTRDKTFSLYLPPMKSECARTQRSSASPPPQIFPTLPLPGTAVPLPLALPFTRQPLVTQGASRKKTEVAALHRSAPRRASVLHPMTLSITPSVQRTRRGRPSSFQVGLCAF